MSDLIQSAIWQALEKHHQEIEPVHMRDMFSADPGRFERFSIEDNGLFLDYSKNRISDKTLSLLIELAEYCQVPQWTERMFNGECINHTEHRAVLHTALRNRGAAPVYVDGQDVMPEIQANLRRMREVSDAIRKGNWLGFSGKPILDVVNLGVGGSDLGPVMVTEALHPYGKEGLHVHFVSNIDPSHICDTLRELNPETTLFIVSSKSFTTQDTLANAEIAKGWLLDVARDSAAVGKHFLAVAENVEAARAFGIEQDNVFSMWDWIGGRYSLWSAIGLSIAIYIGMDRFESMLQGAWDMDQHFRHTPLERNIPVILALLGIWYNNFFNTQSYAVLPYDQHLHRFPAYLQQVDMESNGKNVDRNGQATDYVTGPILWGELGITGQHAFYQLLHQGTKLVPADFIVPINSMNPVGEHHQILLANFFAQTEALMWGKTEQTAREELLAAGMSGDALEDLLPYKVFQGNKPSNTILFKALTPKTLGSLIAMYEHKIFTQGVIWNINSFDQWGVELGKQMAKTIFDELRQGRPVSNHDASTNGLMNYYMKNSRD